MLARNEPEYVTTCWKVQQDSSANYAAMPIDPLDIFRARAAIPKGTLVIAYMQTEFCVFAWICARDRCEVWQLDRASVDESVRKLRRSMEYCEQGVNTGVPVPPMTDWQSPAFLEIRGPLTALYDKLIAPISQSLDGSERLVFALPREFEALPLGALVSGDSQGSPVFLVQSHQISYLARGMLGDLASEKSREIYPNLDSLAIFADPEDNLPGARKEAAIIRSTYPNSRLYVGSERATASSFLAECVKAGILHVAAHHRLSSNPYGFEIVLAPNATSNGIVGIENLAVLRSDSLEMVVLAACDTVGSSNPISTGPARAAEMFSLIGAKSVLGSLWKVSDDAGSEVFREFYKNLSKGNSRAESLRLAQLSMIESKRFAHPFYWACFALYGNPR
jgi:CHAT domain-containing protein